MTPERVREIARNACGVVDTGYSVPLAIPHAVGRAITQAVNEVVAECVKIADDQIRLAAQINDPTGYLVSKEIKNEINALKLPEG